MADIALTAPRKLSLKDLRVAGFFVAIIIYAFYGSPTPEQFGLPEIIIGLLLVNATGLTGLYRALNINNGAEWERGAKLLLVYGLSLPVFIGLVMGNDITGIMRDIIPFLFLLLPLFLCPLFLGGGDCRWYLTVFIAFLGLVFSLRVLLPAMTGFKIVADPFLLANAPTVLFAAMLLMGTGGLFLYRSVRLSSVLKGGCFLVVALAPLLTMALIMQRASIGVFCGAALFLLFIGIIRKPIRALLPFMVLTLAVILLWPTILDVGQTLSRKTSLVGFNMRWQEAMAVMDVLSGSFFTVLLGKGWGATVASPAVGGAVVNFTHSLFTTYWLKTGLVGASLVLFYLYHMGLILVRILFRHPVMALALAGPFMIDVFLYASFKSLDFGLLLLLIPLWAEGTEPLQKSAGYSIQKGSPDLEN